MADVEMAKLHKGNDVAISFGYGAAARFVASDPDHESFVFRKFNELSARKLLYMQSELIYLEEQQNAFDEAVMLSSDDELYSSIWKWEDYRMNMEANEEVKKRKALDDEVAAKLEKYHNALLLQREIARLERPTRIAVETYREALFGMTGNPSIIGGNARMIFDEKNEQDLVALSPAVDKDPMSLFLRRYFPFSGKSLAQHGHARTFEERSLVWIVRLCSVVIAAALLIGSILALYFVTDQDIRLALVIVFIVLFAVGLLVSTSATRESIFAGTAAYAAVLIVFVSGNLGNAKTGRTGP